MAKYSETHIQHKMLVTPQQTMPFNRESLHSMEGILVASILLNQCFSLLQSNHIFGQSKIKLRKEGKKFC